MDEPFIILLAIGFLAGLMDAAIGEGGLCSNQLFILYRFINQHSCNK